MPHYTEDPENPGQHIDVVELLRRDPTKAPPPDTIAGLMKRDKWSRQEALLILAGYHPRNVIHGGLPIGTVGAKTVYLDGTTESMLEREGLQHPVHQDLLPNYLMLANYADGEPMGERRAPKEWLAWAESKGFEPYWLNYWRGYQEIEGALTGQASEKPLSRQLYQEQEILRVIQGLQIDPKALPKNKAGERGVKAEVREHLEFTVGVFDKAWERLRKNKEIQDAP